MDYSEELPVAMLNFKLEAFEHAHVTLSCAFISSIMMALTWLRHALADKQEHAMLYSQAVAADTAMVQTTMCNETGQQLEMRIQDGAEQRMVEIPVGQQQIMLPMLHAERRPRGDIQTLQLPRALVYVTLTGLSLVVRY